MSKERRDITAQHFAAAMLSPVYYDQIYQGEYEKIRFCRLRRTAWSVDPKHEHLIFDPMNGQPKQYISTKHPESWTNFCQSHFGLNAMFNHFNTHYNLLGHVKIDKTFVDRWANALQKGETVGYGELQEVWKNGNMPADSGQQNDLWIRQWNQLEEVKNSVTPDATPFPYMKAFIKTTLQESFVTFVFLYEPFLYSEHKIRDSKNIMNYSNEWAKFHGFRPPAEFARELETLFDRRHYVAGTHGPRYPFKQPFGMMDKIVFPREGSGEPEYSVKLTMCTSTNMRSRFRVYIDSPGVGNPFDTTLVFPMHFSVVYHPEEDDPDYTEPYARTSMFFYTTVENWKEIIITHNLYEPGSWLLPAHDLRAAIAEAEYKDMVEYKMLPKDGFREFKKREKKSRIKSKTKQAKLQTEPFSWPDNIVFVREDPDDDDNDDWVLAKKYQIGPDEPLTYADTPRWPYHCVYHSANYDGSGSDCLLDDYAVIERKVDVGSTDDGMDRRVVLVSHGYIPNEDYVRKYNKEFFDGNEEVTSMFLKEYWMLLKVDNPFLERMISDTIPFSELAAVAGAAAAAVASGVGTDDVPDGIEYPSRPDVEFEKLDPRDLVGNIFTFTPQCYDGIFPFVLDNTKIAEADTYSRRTQVERDYIERQTFELRLQMFGDDARIDPRDAANTLERMFEEGVLAERNIVRRCSQVNDIDHYFYNVPVSARPDQHGIHIQGETMRHWLLTDYTSCVFTIRDRTTGKVVENNNNFVFTRLTNIEELTQRPTKSDQKSVPPIQRIGRQSGRTTVGFFAFDFKNFQLGIPRDEKCLLPGLNGAALVTAEDNIDLRLFPSIRIVGPPQMYSAPGIWGYVHTFLSKNSGMRRGMRYTMLIKDIRTNNAICLFSNDRNNYIFVPKQAPLLRTAEEFTLLQINQNEHNDFSVLERIRKSKAFTDIKRTTGSSVYFMRSFTTVEDQADYDAPCSEKTASSEFFTSGQRPSRMAHHTFKDGSSPGSESECIGEYIRVESGQDEKGVVCGGMEGHVASSRIQGRINLLRTRTTTSGVATHGLKGLWQCWYCGCRVRTLPYLSEAANDSLNFSTLHYPS